MRGQIGGGMPGGGMRRTVRRKSGTRMHETRSAAAADLLLMLEDAEIARVAGLHSALPNF